MKRKAVKQIQRRKGRGGLYDSNKVSEKLSGFGHCKKTKQNTF